MQPPFSQISVKIQSKFSQNSVETFSVSIFMKFEQKRDINLVKFADQTLCKHYGTLMMRKTCLISTEIYVVVLYLLKVWKMKWRLDRNERIKTTSKFTISDLHTITKIVDICSMSKVSVTN